MIPVYEPVIGKEELQNLLDCVKSGWISSIGSYITKFEDAFARFCGANFGIATSNGTTALHLALYTLGIGQGDEVILPSLTFIATANAVKYVGAIPVFVDSEPIYWNIDVEKIEKKITRKTKAIICVHLYGHPVDMDPITSLARKYNIYVIEDAAEAHGARYKGNRVGSIGDVGCFSFYGNKIITTGEGGMIVTNNPKINDKSRYYRDHAMSKTKRYWHEEIGFNFRMTNLQAALGVAQLNKIDYFINRKRKIATLYQKLFREIEDIETSIEAPWAQSVYWMFCIIGNKKHFDRDNLIQKLKLKDIDTRPFFYPIHSLPPYFSKEKFPIAERLAANGLNLPSSPLLTDEQIIYIAYNIKQILM